MPRAYGFPADIVFPTVDGVMKELVENFFMRLLNVLDDGGQEEFSNVGVSEVETMIGIQVQVIEPLTHCPILITGFSLNPIVGPRECSSVEEEVVLPSLILGRFVLVGRNGVETEGLGIGSVLGENLNLLEEELAFCLKLLLSQGEPMI